MSFNRLWSIVVFDQNCDFPQKGCRPRTPPKNKKKEVPVALNGVAKSTCERQERHSMFDLSFLAHSIYCLLIVYWLPRMFSHDGYGPRPKAQGPKAAGPPGPGPAAPWGLVLGWSLVRGPYRLWLNECASRAMNRQSMAIKRQYMRLHTLPLSIKH